MLEKRGTEDSEIGLEKIQRPEILRYQVRQLRLILHLMVEEGVTSSDRTRKPRQEMPNVSFASLKEYEMFSNQSL
jgi:hypothetical protein